MRFEEVHPEEEALPGPGGVGRSHAMASFTVQAAGALVLGARAALRGILSL